MKIDVFVIPVHEGTLLCALEMLALWSGKFVSEVPVKLIEWLKVYYIASFIPYL